MFGWFRKRTSPAEEQIDGILINLRVGDEPLLFLMLESNGSVNRIGTGSADDTERDMFIGRTGPEPFQQLRTQITPQLLTWCGHQFADPEPQGEGCELTVGFKWTGGQSQFALWQYGSDSQGPPAEVFQFVDAAIEATNPWFEQQKARILGAEN